MVQSPFSTVIAIKKLLFSPFENGKNLEEIQNPCLLKKLKSEGKKKDILEGCKSLTIPSFKKKHKS